MEAGQANSITCDHLTCELLLSLLLSFPNSRNCAVQPIEVFNHLLIYSSLWSGSRSLGGRLAACGGVEYYPGVSLNLVGKCACVPTQCLYRDLTQEEEIPTVVFQAISHPLPFSISWSRCTVVAPIQMYNNNIILYALHIQG